MREVVVRSSGGKLRQSIEIGPHGLAADEPEDNGGEDAGPEPHELVLAGLGACKSMTVKLYAARKGWPVEGVEVSLSQEKQPDAHVIRCAVRLMGPLTDEQRARLLEIADRCPVHRTLTGAIRIESTLA